MNYKQRFQKVLCIALAAASVSSMITPIVYAAKPQVISLPDKPKALLVDANEKDCLNKVLAINGRLYGSSSYKVVIKETAEIKCERPQPGKRLVLLVPRSDLDGVDDLAAEYLKNGEIADVPQCVSDESDSSVVASSSCATGGQGSARGNQTALLGGAEDCDIRDNKELQTTQSTATPTTAPNSGEPAMITIQFVVKTDAHVECPDPQTVRVASGTTIWDAYRKSAFPQWLDRNDMVIRCFEPENAGRKVEVTQSESKSIPLSSLPSGVIIISPKRVREAHRRKVAFENPSFDLTFVRQIAREKKRSGTAEDSLLPWPGISTQQPQPFGQQSMAGTYTQGTAGLLGQQTQPSAFGSFSSPPFLNTAPACPMFSAASSPFAWQCPPTPSLTTNWTGTPAPASPWPAPAYSASGPSFSPCGSPDAAYFASSPDTFGDRQEASVCSQTTTTTRWYPQQNQQATAYSAASGQFVPQNQLAGSCPPNRGPFVASPALPPYPVSSHAFFPPSPPAPCYPAAWCLFVPQSQLAGSRPPNCGPFGAPPPLPAYPAGADAFSLPSQERCCCPEVTPAAAGHPRSLPGGLAQRPVSSLSSSLQTPTPSATSAAPIGSALSSSAQEFIPQSLPVAAYSTSSPAVPQPSQQRSCAPAETPAGSDRSLSLSAGLAQDAVNLLSPPLQAASVPSPPTTAALLSAALLLGDKLAPGKIHPFNPAGKKPVELAATHPPTAADNGALTASETPTTPATSVTPAGSDHSLSLPGGLAQRAVNSLSPPSQAGSTTAQPTPAGVPCAAFPLAVKFASGNSKTFSLHGKNPAELAVSQTPTAADNGASPASQSPTATDVTQPMTQRLMSLPLSDISSQQSSPPVSPTLTTSGVSEMPIVAPATPVVLKLSLASPPFLTHKTAVSTTGVESGHSVPSQNIVLEQAGQSSSQSPTPRVVPKRALSTSNFFAPLSLRATANKIPTEAEDASTPEPDAHALPLQHHNAEQTAHQDVQTSTTASQTATPAVAPQTPSASGSSGPLQNSSKEQVERMSSQSRTANGSSPPTPLATPAVSFASDHSLSVPNIFTGQAGLNRAQSPTPRPVVPRPKPNETWWERFKRIKPLLRWKRDQHLARQKQIAERRAIATNTTNPVGDHDDVLTHRVLLEAPFYVYI